MKFLLSLSFLLSWNTCYSQEDTIRKYIDQFSTCSLFLLSRNGTNPLASATGFLIRVNKTVYLLTNNHVLGLEYHINEYKRFNKGKTPSRDSIPDNLLVRMYDKNIGVTNTESISLFDKNNNPLFIKFYTDPLTKKSLLDVVAIPLTGVNTVFPNYGTTLAKEQVNQGLVLYPSLELFVVGFPNDWGTRGNPYPIWKKGSIASEPNFLNFGEPRFYIDATTRRGMSGSPVYFRGNFYKDKNGETMSHSYDTFLIGIYSAQDFDSEIGTVTRISDIFRELENITN